MKPEQEIASYPEYRVLTRKGVASYRESGSGPALVLLHGISSGAASWIHQLHGLGSVHRVIAWDAPGYGVSSHLPVPTPLASDYADSLHALVETLTLDNFILVGHSLGALIAAAYAQANPRQVRRLILMSPARGYASAGRTERVRRYARRMETLVRLGPEGLARERARALLSPAASPEAVAWVGWNMRRLNPKGYRQAARMLVEDDIGFYAKGYSEGVVVASGGADTITPSGKCRWVARQFRGGCYEAFDHLGHALYIESPARINKFLLHQAKV